MLRRLYVDGELRRVVEMDLLEGRIEAKVAPGGDGSTFDVNTRAGVAGVRGTEFAVSPEGEEAKGDGDGDLRIETIEGMVAKERDGREDVEVPAGSTAGISSGGDLIPTSELVDAPRIVEPLFGSFDARGKPEWDPVQGNKGYLVELARDAEFTLAVQELPQKRTTHALPKELGDGKWFWRVTALDENGHLGVPSKVYAFTLGDPEEPEKAE